MATTWTLNIEHWTLNLHTISASSARKPRIQIPDYIQLPALLHPPVQCPIHISRARFAHLTGVLSFPSLLIKAIQRVCRSLTSSHPSSNGYITSILAASLRPPSAQEQSTLSQVHYASLYVHTPLVPCCLISRSSARYVAFHTPCPLLLIHLPPFSISNELFPPFHLKIGLLLIEHCYVC